MRRAGAGGYQNYQPGYQKKILARSAKKIDLVKMRLPNFFVMATSSVLECNSHFKYPKFSPAALNNSAIWLQIVLFLNIFSFFEELPFPNTKRKRKPEKKGKRKEEKKGGGEETIC